MINKGNTHKSIKRLSLLILIFGFSLFFFSSKVFQEEYNIRKINFARNIPMVSLQGELKNFNDSAAVYFYKNQVLYRNPEYHTVENDDSIISIKIKYNYFVLTKGNTHGYYFFQRDYKSGKKMNADSLIKRKGLLWKLNYGDDNDILLSEISTKNYKLIQKYLTKNIIDQSYPDTTIIYYTDAMKGIDFSLAKNLDSINGLKVSKIRHIYNSQYYKGYDIKVPKRELWVSIREDTISNPKKILEMFNYYKDKK